MRAVEDDQRPFRHDVEAPRPVDVAQAAADRVLVDSPALRAQSFERRHRDRGILMLKRTGEPELEIAQVEAEAVVVQSMRRRVRRVRKIAIDQTHRAAALASDRRQRQPRLGIARANHDRHLVA